MEGTKPESESPVSTASWRKATDLLYYYEIQIITNGRCGFDEETKADFLLYRTLFAAPKGKWFPGVAGIVPNVQRNG